jgi:hypothetical protein
MDYGSLANRPFLRQMETISQDWGLFGLPLVCQCVGREQRTHQNKYRLRLPF